MTHYVVPFSARAICGALGTHATEPDCPNCRALLDEEAETERKRLYIFNACQDDAQAERNRLHLAEAENEPPAMNIVARAATERRITIDRRREERRK